MVHSTPSRKKAQEMRQLAMKCERESAALDKIPGTKKLARERTAQARKLRENIPQLKKQARLEDLTVRQEPLIKRTKKGEERVYVRWVTSWREEGRIRKVYLGSCSKMSHEEALHKAWELKKNSI
jgi:hypothetical protein